MSTLSIKCCTRKSIGRYRSCEIFNILSWQYDSWDELYKIIKKSLKALFQVKNNIEIKLLFGCFRIPCNNMHIDTLKQDCYPEIELYYQHTIYAQCENCFRPIITEDHQCFSTRPDLIKLWHRDTNKCFESGCDHRILYMEGLN